MNGTHVTVGSGATLHASDLVVDGHIQAQGAAVVDEVQIGGDLILEVNQWALSATRNRVGGNLQAIGNASGVVVRNNSITGTLQCQNNLLTPLGGVNQAASLENQCATLNMAIFLPVIAGQP